MVKQAKQTAGRFVAFSRPVGANKGGEETWMENEEIFSKGFFFSLMEKKAGGKRCRTGLIG